MFWYHYVVFKDKAGGITGGMFTEKKHSKPG